MEGIKTRLGRYNAGWVDELPNVLWSHRTSLKQSNGETPFSLTYASEVMIPAEIGMPTHITMMIREDENKDELRLNMDLLQERREATAIREAKYKAKMEQYYNQMGEYVFWRNKASRVEDQGKLGPKWEGPYREIRRSSRIDDEVVQDQRQRDDNDLQDERQDQLKEEEFEPRRSKRARTEKSFGLDFISFMVENEHTSYREAVTSSEGLNGKKPLKVK
ncbi:reverse transcriptase domain-containing protein [Tanacetum coccineum]